MTIKKSDVKGTGKFDAMGGEIPQEIIDALNLAEQAKVNVDALDAAHDQDLKAIADSTAKEQTSLAAALQGHKDANEKYVAALNLIKQRYGL